MKDIRVGSRLMTTLLQKMCKIGLFMLRFLCIIGAAGILGATALYFAFLIVIFVVGLLV